MKTKQKALCVLISGVVIMLLGIIIPVLFTYQRGAIGIIGGAEAPTWFFISALFNGFPCVVFLLGISLIISGGFCLIFSNTVKTCCNIKTSLLSAGLSGTCALETVCALALSTRTHLQNAKIFIIALGILCLIAFVALLIQYIKLRKGNKSLKGIIIDIFTFILYAPSFFYAFSYLYEVIF